MRMFRPVPDRSSCGKQTHQDEILRPGGWVYPTWQGRVIPPLANKGDTIPARQPANCRFASSHFPSRSSRRSPAPGVCQPSEGGSTGSPSGRQLEMHSKTLPTSHPLGSSWARPGAPLPGMLPSRSCQELKAVRTAGLKGFGVQLPVRRRTVTSAVSSTHPRYAPQLGGTQLPSWGLPLDFESKNRPEAVASILLLRLFHLCRGCYGRCRQVARKLVKERNAGHIAGAWFYSPRL